MSVATSRCMELPLWSGNYEKILALQQLINMTQEESTDGLPRRLRKRRHCHISSPSAAKWASVENVVEEHRNHRWLVFSGAGLSASTGLATFQKGAYKAAEQKYNVTGVRAFSYDFLQTSPQASFDLLTKLYRAAEKAQPTAAHKALERMKASGNIIQHYTMNIDGLHSADALELHGTLHEMVCRQCCHVVRTKTVLTSHTSRGGINPRQLHCSQCDGMGTMRYRVLLYGDTEGSLIRATNPLDQLLPKDLQNQCQWMVWAGISFHQRASCETFRRVLQQCRRETKVYPTIYIVNPSAAEAWENLETVLGEELVDVVVLLVESDSDTFFEALEAASAAVELPGTKKSG